MKPTFSGLVAFAIGLGSMHGCRGTDPGPSDSRPIEAFPAGDPASPGGTTAPMMGTSATPDEATGNPICAGTGCVCPEGQSSCAGAQLGGAGACATGLLQCGTACVDTRSDGQNCGACGLRCGAGECANGACPQGRACAVERELVAAPFADFESYVSGTPPESFNFSFNSAPGTPLAVYAGPYHFSDGTGAQTLSMVPGDSSNYAVSISGTGASAWGGGLGFWMGCIDASSFDGVAFSVRGRVPGNSIQLTLGTEDTSAPAADNPNTGGTCLLDCVAPSAAVPVDTEWRRVILPWSAFTAGTANQASVPASGDSVMGLSFGVSLEWAEVAGQLGTYAPVTADYEIALDDLAFFHTREACSEGQSICDSECVDLSSDADHCGGCGRACTGGSSCAGARGCVCPDALTFCGGTCADLQSDTSHCGACGNFCSIGALCTAGRCSDDAGTTSNRCGEPTRRLGNPFACEFGWGANPDFAPPEFLTFATKWVGYEPGAVRCDGCTWLSSFGNTDVIPAYIAYFVAFRGNADAGLGDCNLDFDGNNLCTGGAQFIRNNRARLISIYADYARRSYAAYPNRPVVWIVEPDFIQYTTGNAALSMQELGQFASDIICAIKSNMPNAVIALNHSTWIRDAELRSYWQNMPLDLIDLLHISSMANVAGGYFNDYDAIGRDDGTFRFLRQLTGRPILADTSFGITTQADSWSSANAATLNARIADGVIGALIYPTPNAYEQRINTLRPQLDSTCE